MAYKDVSRPRQSVNVIQTYFNTESRDNVIFEPERWRQCRKDCKTVANSYWLEYNVRVIKIS